MFIHFDGVSRPDGLPKLRDLGELLQTELAVLLEGLEHEIQELIRQLLSSNPRL